MLNFISRRGCKYLSAYGEGNIFRNTNFTRETTFLPVKSNFHTKVLYLCDYVIKKINKTLINFDYGRHSKFQK